VDIDQKEAPKADFASGSGVALSRLSARPLFDLSVKLGKGCFPNHPLRVRIGEQAMLRENSEWKDASLR
jgi:hypothetical protein